MRKIIGNEVCVYLKTSDRDAPDVFGLLIDVSEDSLYLQGPHTDPRVYIVPRDNVDYCTTDCIPAAERSRQLIEDAPPKPQQAPTPEPVQETKQIGYLSVFVDDVQIAHIPLPPTFKLDQWHDGIMRTIMGNPDVQAALRGKMQESLEYYPGEVYIKTEDGNRPAMTPEQETNQVPQTAFTMGGGNPTSQFVNPSQMISRLNNAAVRRGKKNDEETNM